MPSTTNFQIKQTYSFNVYPVAILGNNFTNVTVLAIMDSDTANREIDVQAMHVNLYPFLPAGTPNDPAAYNYVKIRTTTGQTTILGLAWINADTVTLLASRTITVKISNVSAVDVARVQNALIQNGFTAIDIGIS